MTPAAGTALAFAALLCTGACQRFPTGGIEGTVSDHSGAPIANVHVGVVGLAHSEPSDASGRFLLPRVPTGTHRLRATAVGYVPLERDSVVVRRGAITRVDFTLDRTWPGLGFPSDRAGIGQPPMRHSDGWKPGGYHSSSMATFAHEGGRSPRRWPGSMKKPHDHGATVGWTGS